MLRLFFSFALLWGLCSVPAFSADTKRYASIVVDADTLEIIHARQIDATRFPASLTKVMTLYLTFDALNAGQLTLNQALPVSRHAARTAPTKLGLRAGQTITVENAIKALTVKSSNDVAVVLAEAIAGTEGAFTELMTAKARQLGMLGTTFKTPHGLPDPDQVTTARDMAKLASAILNTHRRYYHYFGMKTFWYNGRTHKNTNGLLHSMAEVDGFKTGFTNASGYNLIISAQKDGRRLIAVVLGGASGTSRNAHMEDLIRRGFAVIGIAPPERLAPVSVVETPVPHLRETVVAKTPVVTHAVRLRGRNSAPVTVITGQADVNIPDLDAEKDWGVQVGAFKTQKAAVAQLTALNGFADTKLTTDTATIAPQKRGDVIIYRARFEKLTFEDAQTACIQLKNLQGGCFVINPG